MEWRACGLLAALFLGFGPAIFLYGPVLFDGVSPSSLSPLARIAGIGLGIFGAWLALVTLLAPVDNLRKVLEPLNAVDAAVLFLPYMLYAGSRALWHSLRRRRS